jgi:polyhydroxyalkanoate synthesis regulator phasin
MRRRKIVAFAGIAALAVAGAGAALAGNGAFSSEDTGQAVIDDAAEELGIEPAELSDALENALEKQIDEAEEDGRLSQEQADALRERLQSMDMPLLFPRFGLHDRGPEPFGGLGHLHVGVVDLDAAASYLGLTRAELRSQLADGKSLAEIARAEGKSVDGLVQALVEDVSERIDAAVDDGRLSDDQAAELKEDLPDRITRLVNREPGWAPFFDRGFGPRLDRGDRPFEHRPPFFSGPRA